MPVLLLQVSSTADPFWQTLLRRLAEGSPHAGKLLEEKLSAEALSRIGARSVPSTVVSPPARGSATVRTQSAWGALLETQPGLSALQAILGNQQAAAKTGKRAYPDHRRGYRIDLFALTGGKAITIYGQNKVVEVDETYVGGKAANRKNRIPPKEPVVALVERQGRVRSRHVANVDGKNLKPILKEQIHKATHVMTDDSTVYPPITGEFAGHSTVNHSIEEYVRGGGFIHTNTVENYFSIFKREITGIYHHVSEQHLKRYLCEFVFRYNER